MPHHRSNLYALLTFAALLLWQSLVFACTSVTLVYSNSHFNIVHRIEASFYAKHYTQLKLNHLLVDQLTDKEASTSIRRSCLIVTVGTEALEEILKTKTPIPILSIIIRKKTFEELLKQHQRHLPDPNYPITAIYLDQPFDRQLDFIQCLLPDEETKIGILLSTNSQETQDEIHRLANEKKMGLTAIIVNKFENPVQILDALLDETQLILAIPDNQIYNPKTTGGMLLTAFRKQVPLIGYSRTFVNNGAIAGIYSTTKQLAEQTAKQILVMINTPIIVPLPQYPEKYEIAVNYNVAQSLGLKIQSLDQLKLQMHKLDKKEQAQNG